MTTALASSGAIHSIKNKPRSIHISTETDAQPRSYASISRHEAATSRQALQTERCRLANRKSLPKTKAAKANFAPLLLFSDDAIPQPTGQKPPDSQIYINR